MRRECTEMAIGMSRTEMLSKVHTLKALREGIDCGDIVQKGKFYYWARNVETRTKGTLEEVGAAFEGEADAAALKGVLDGIKEYDAGFAVWGLDEQASSSNATAQDRQAAIGVVLSAEGMMKLQEAYDSFQACQRNSYSLCRGWTNATQTVNDLIGRTTDLCKVCSGDK